ncbi:hypothetical protein V498_03198 [Pseudogymnoascus sp. VKM F-4517 (FW-2822)]|nr:hypothetical protein V498_03198 [Pseudogymnoascus sp. VKM F-4517 (FW-2822)]
MLYKKETFASSNGKNSFVDDRLASIFLCSHDKLQWYRWWIYDQVQSQPNQLFSTLHGYDPKIDDSWIGSFSTMWQEVSQYMTATASVSIDEIVAHLLEFDILELGSDPNALIAAKNLIFAVIGWQTMLYQADMHSCPPEQLAIQSQMGVHQGQAHMCLKQNHSSCRRRMHEFLLGYGLLLPPRNFEGLGSVEDKKAFAEFKSVSSTSFNASLLSSIGDVTIEWVDSLSCHMEFDPYLNKLFLFRYPSFCLANIPADGSGHSTKSAIYACATPRDSAGQWATTADVNQMLQETTLSYRLLFGQNKASRQLFQKSKPYACATPRDSAGQWATTADVTQMLQETTLSYRLLFGQNKSSRQLFQKSKPFENIPEAGRDTFLERLCGRKRYQSNYNSPERETYDLAHDFPILRSRLLPLLRHLSAKKPRTWRELWEDKRDSASWLTFWAVLVIGGMGLILAMLQTILQIVQVIQH